MSAEAEVTAPARGTVSLSASLAAAALAVPTGLLLALPGLVYVAGFDHLAYLLGLLAGAVLAGVWIAPKIAEAAANTLVEALRHRFGNGTARLAALVIALAILSLLTANLDAVASLLDVGFRIPPRIALAGAVALSIAGAFLLDDRRFRLIAALAFAALALAVIALLALLSMRHGTDSLPLLGYGPSLPAIATLEDMLLETGAVDFASFGAHTATFLKLSPLDFAALVLSLAAGIAVFPPLVRTLAAGHTPAATRLTGAWSVVWLMAVLIAIPPLAAHAKIELYGALARPTPLAALPAWVEAPSRAGLVHIHGTSLGLLEEVARAVEAGDADSTAISNAIATRSLALANRWDELDDAVRTALVDTARTRPQNADPTAAWAAYVTGVLPAAATAAGDETGTLTQGALVIEPLAVLSALPALAGAPEAAAPLAVLSAFAAIVLAAALLRTLLALRAPHDASGTPRSARPSRVLALSIAAIAAAFAALRGGEGVPVAVSGLSLLAAGLFPVAALGLSWRRVSAAAAASAIIAGAAVSLYYDIGTQIFPVAFYKTWPNLSDAGEAAIEEFGLLEDAVNGAADDATKAQARAALADFAAGTATRPGLANWAGIDPAASAVFAVPAGLMVLILVTVAIPARRRPQP